jgi:hypothetical protein
MSVKISSNKYHYELYDRLRVMCQNGKQRDLAKRLAFRLCSMYETCATSSILELHKIKFYNDDHACVIFTIHHPVREMCYTILSINPTCARFLPLSLDEFNNLDGIDDIVASRRSNV